MKTLNKLSIALAEIYLRSRKMDGITTEGEYKIFFSRILVDYHQDTGDKRVSLTGMSAMHRICAIMGNEFTKSTLKTLEKEHKVLSADVFVRSISMLAISESEGCSSLDGILNVTPLMELMCADTNFPPSLQPIIKYGKHLPPGSHVQLATLAMKVAATISTFWGTFHAIEDPCGAHLSSVFSPISKEDVRFDLKTQTGSNFSIQHAIEGWNVFMQILDEELSLQFTSADKNKCPRFASMFMSNVFIMTFSVTIQSFKGKIKSYRWGDYWTEEKVVGDIEKTYELFLQDVLDVHDQTGIPIFQMENFMPVPLIPHPKTDASRVPHVLAPDEDEDVEYVPLQSTQPSQSIVRPKTPPTKKKAGSRRRTPRPKKHAEKPPLSPQIPRSPLAPSSSSVERSSPSTVESPATPSPPPDAQSAPVQQGQRQQSVEPITIPESPTPKRSARSTPKRSSSRRVSFADAVKGKKKHIQQIPGIPTIPLTLNIGRRKRSSDESVEDVQAACINADRNEDQSKKSSQEAKLSSSSSSDSSGELDFNSPEFSSFLSKFGSQSLGKRRKILEKLMESTATPAAMEHLPANEASAEQANDSRKKNNAENPNHKQLPPPPPLPPVHALPPVAPLPPVGNPQTGTQQQRLDSTEARLSEAEATAKRVPSPPIASVEGKPHAEKPLPTTNEVIDHKFDNDIAPIHSDLMKDRPNAGAGDSHRERRMSDELTKNMNDQIERRERNRARNREISLRDMKQRYSSDIRAFRNIMVGAPVDTPRFELDNPDSDNEDAQDFREVYARVGSSTRGRSSPSQEETLRIDLEILMFQLTIFSVDPRFSSFSPADDSLLKDLSPQNHKWLREFFNANRDLFCKELTRASIAEEYSDHIKLILYLENFFQVQQALLKEFPKLRNDPDAVARVLFNNTGPLYKARVDSVDSSRLLTNISCTSSGANSNMRTSMLQNFTGMTVCVGMFFDTHGRGRPSRAQVLLCRSLSHSGLVIEDPFGDPKLSEVKLRMVANRLYSDEWTPREEDELRLWPLCSIVTQLRMFRAVHNTYRLPQRMQDTLWGSPFSKVHTLPIRKMPDSLEEYERMIPPLDTLRSSVDAGCLRYVDSLPSTRCDESQKRALLTSLAENKDMARGSCSLSLTLGPPGTGKSTTIALMVGAMLHHSKVGHIGNGFQRTTKLKEDDGEITFSNNPDGIRILLTCAANHGVDEVTRKLQNGVPSEDGSTLLPKMVRVGRQNYDYKDIEKFSVQKLALAYEHQVISPDQAPPRMFPSRQAKLLLMEECVIVLCTSSTAGGPTLQNLGVKESLTIIDEAAHASEADAMTAIMANAMHNQHGRVHAVLVGDQNQLSPVHVSQHSAVTFLSKNRDFNFRIKMIKQYDSLFLRAFSRDLAPFSMLQNEYRSHPSIGAVQSKFMYRNIVSHPGNPVDYNTTFNNVDRPWRIRPLSIIETSAHNERYERRSRNGFTNSLEARIVNKLLFQLESLCPGEDPLANNVIVCAPYRAQVQHISDTLMQPGNFLERRNPKRMNMVVDTIDALQGSERSIVIISITRSNEMGDIGFLADNRRLNVATSRAKHLLILVGDSSCYRKSYLLDTIYRDVFEGANGTSIVNWGTTM